MASSKRWVAAGAAGAALLWLRRKQVDLSGECALVTGGSRGLGRDIARALSDAGCRVGLVARDVEELHRARDELARGGTHLVDVFECDLRDPERIYACVQQVLERWGRIDILVNNAGIIQVGPLAHMGLEDFEQAMAVHFWAPLHMTRAVVPAMRQQGGGRIVNIASVGGKVAIPHLAPYCASKFALVGLSDALRAELARDGISVTTVCPGLMRTGSHQNVQVKGQHQREFAWFSMGAAAPTLSMSAERAARRIVRACQRREPAVHVGLPAKLLIGADALAPSITGHVMAFANRLLPDPTDERGSEMRSGWESHSRFSPSLLTRLADREVPRHNEMTDHSVHELRH